MCICRCVSQPAVSGFPGYLKEKDALGMFDKHTNQKHRFGNGHFGAEGHYVTTAGVNKATIRRHIRDQERDDVQWTG